MPEGARILMGDTRHGSLQPYSVVALGGTLAYISPGTSAYWDECLYSYSGLLLCSRTRKPYPSFFVYFLWAITLCVSTQTHNVSAFLSWRSRDASATFQIKLAGCCRRFIEVTASAIVGTV
jgi:hypothetical protein